MSTSHRTPVHDFDIKAQLSLPVLEHTEDAPVSLDDLRAAEEGADVSIDRRLERRIRYVKWSTHITLAAKRLSQSHTTND